MRITQLLAAAILVAGAIPCAAQTVVNGDFEQGPTSGWTSWSNPAGIGLIGTAAFFASTEISPAVVPRSGSWMGRLGGFSYAENALSQVITLPNVRPLYLGFWYQSRSTSGSECGGLWVGARIRVVIAEQVLTDIYLCQYNDPHQWTYGYYDVSAAAGQQIQFGIRADAANTMWSYLYLDDVVVTQSTAVGVEPDGVLPEAFALDAAFPNPFAGVTQIPVELPGSSVVRLTVFDALGREVSSAPEQLLPAGRHLLDFDGTRLAPGVYVGRVESGSSVRTVRLVRGG